MADQLSTEIQQVTHSRRKFLSASFSVSSGFGVSAALTSLGGRLAYGESQGANDGLVPTADEATGLNLLRLPEGFRYVSYGWTKDPMACGGATPASHDGMGVVRADGDLVTLVRNHEVSSDGPAIASDLEPYDPNAQGGCTSLQFDVGKGEWKKSWVSLTGSSRNCAGGITPWGTWLTAEETVLGPKSMDSYNKNVRRDFTKSHGWIFEVDPDGTKEPVPLRDMGRFVHEAVAFDHKTGIVYETEDRKTAGFYRFVPNKPGVLAEGGSLEVAEVVGQPDLRGGVAAGSTFDVRWHKIDKPRQANSPGKGKPDELGVFAQAKAMGGSMFARLEGCWYGDGMIYFDATSGGAAAAGQIWKYDPQSEKLSLIFESPSKDKLNMPDNLCVNPGGGLILCEDNDYGVEDYPQRMFALSQDGQLKLIGQNNVVLNGEKNGFKGDFRDKEWAGACFSPDGKWLFVNLQTPGITVAITGPWSDVL